MAFGDGILENYFAGFTHGQQRKEAARRNAISEAFKSAYTPGRVGYGGEEYENEPPSYNMDNAIAQLYKGGFGPEAFEVQSKAQNNEIARLLAGAKLADATRPKFGEPKPGLIGGREGFFRTDDRGNVYDMSGNPIRDPIQPRPQKPLVQIDTGTKEADKEFIKETRENFSRLRDAPTALKNIEEAKLLIPKAGVFMGTGGGTLLESAKFLNNRLGLQIQTEGIKSAEELRSRVFFQILENLKKMDASPSQKQQEVMMQALGNLDTDPNALSSILDAFGDAVRDKVATHNTIVTDAEKRGTKFPHRVTVDIPAKAGKGAIGTPDGPKLQPGKTIEDGYIYLGGDPGKPESWKPLR